MKVSNSLPIVYWTVLLVSLCTNTVFAASCRVGPIRNARDFFKSLWDTYKEIKEEKQLCDADVEQPKELYSDFMIMQAWPYCVKKFGGTKTGIGRNRRYDWERLGLDDREVKDKEGEDLYPFKRGARRGGVVRANRAAKRVGVRAGNFRWVGTWSTSLLGFLEFVQENPIDTRSKKQAKLDFHAAAGPTVEAYNDGLFHDLIDAFRSGKDNPTKVLSAKAIEDLMVKCDVPSNVADNFRAAGVEVMYEGAED